MIAAYNRVVDPSLYAGKPDVILAVLLDENSFYLVTLSDDGIKLYFNFEIDIADLLQQPDSLVHVIDVMCSHTWNDE